jgi:hypothetical protein
MAQLEHRKNPLNIYLINVVCNSVAFRADFASEHDIL